MFNYRDYILDIISICIVLSFIVYITTRYANKSWKCIEGKCEKVGMGDYNSISECQSGCNSPVQTTYSCNTSENRCVEVNGPNGQFNKLLDCQNNCIKQPVMYSNQYYYPTIFTIPTSFFPRTS